MLRVSATLRSERPVTRDACALRYFQAARSGLPNIMAGFAPVRGVNFWAPPLSTAAVSLWPSWSTPKSRTPQNAPGTLPRVARQRGETLGPAHLDVVGADDVLPAALARHDRESRFRRTLLGPDPIPGEPPASPARVTRQSGSEGRMSNAPEIG